MPPNAEMGSAITARRYASSTSSREAPAQGVGALNMAHVGGAKAEGGGGRHWGGGKDNGQEGEGAGVAPEDEDGANAWHKGSKGG